MLKLIVLIIGAVAAASSTASLKRYDDYKVFRVTPVTDLQLESLRDLGLKDEDYQFWKEPTIRFRPAYLMVPPDKLQNFALLMNVTGIDYQTHVENVQTLIDRANPVPMSKSTTDYSSDRFYTYEEINAWLDQLAAKYDQVEVVVGGRTYEGRLIKGVKVSWGKGNPGIFLEAGIHANEWIGPATAMYVLNEFLTSKDPKIRRLAEAYDWYVFPIFNPDGYAYTFEKDRLWRKTRIPNGNGCYGVDPNRNWDYQWMNGGASDDPCHRNYAGKSPFSEIETRTISNYISSISGKLFAFISFHSYGQHLLLPYGHTKEHLDNYDELFAVGKKSIDTLARRHGTIYDIGNIPEVLYIDSGSSMDWVKGVHKLPITYTYELRDEGLYGFLVPANLIIPTGEEVLDSFVTMFEEASKLGYPKKLEQS